LKDSPPFENGFSIFKKRGDALKRVRELRIKIQNETRITNNHIARPNFESNFENHQISSCYAKT